MRYSSVFAGIVFLVAMPSLLFAEPVAPLLKLNERGLEVMKAEGKTLADMEKAVPTKASVGIPIYPGAFLASSSSSSTMLSAVNLVSSDSPETIKAWYEKNLTDWTYDPKFRLFHDGKGKVDWSSLMDMQTIEIVADEEPGLDLMFYETPKLKSRIIIRYKERE
jgi:hypothetical protein